MEKTFFKVEDDDIKIIRSDKNEDFIFEILKKEKELNNLKNRRQIFNNDVITQKMYLQCKKLMPTTCLISLGVIIVIFSIASLVELMKISRWLTFMLLDVAVFVFFDYFYLGTKKEIMRKLGIAESRVSNINVDIEKLELEIERLKNEANFRVVDKNTEDNSYSFDFDRKRSLEEEQLLDDNDKKTGAKVRKLQQ